VPARGQRIPMPGNQADWPQDGQPVNPIDGYQARLVRDGDLVVKPDDLPTPEAEAVTEIPRRRSRDRAIRKSPIR
jgi:hypothetical protein